jgi:hypothetical protein
MEAMTLRSFARMENLASSGRPPPLTSVGLLWVAKACGLVASGQARSRLSWARFGPLEQYLRVDVAGVVTTVAATLLLAGGV